MIYEVEGDLMLSRAEVIVQGVGTFDPMTTGLSRKLHERFPSMVEEYRAWCEEENPEPGQLWMWDQPGKLSIINLITHEGDDDPTRLRRADKIALNRSLKALNAFYYEKRFKSMAMPMVGTGEYGLDWTDVRDMMHAQLGDLLIPIFVYTKQLDGQIAYEPGM